MVIIFRLNFDKSLKPLFVFLEPRQSHTTIAVIDRHPDGTFGLRALKQKLYVDGLSYLLQEIYGIENKNNENKVCIGAKKSLQQVTNAL
jgi:hypothetical protein